MIRRVASALLLAALPWAAAVAQAPIVIRFGVVARDTPTSKGAEYFKELAEVRTEGRVKVELHADSTPDKNDEEVDALQRGAMQILAPSLGSLGRIGVREFEVFDLPYIFDNDAELHKVTDGPIGASLMTKLEAKAITGLAYWDGGFKDMSANKPLRKPADLRGLRMRIQPSHVLDSQMRALGAIPQVMAFSEVYEALRTELIDGTENPPSKLHAQKIDQVQKYLTLSHHGYLGYAVIANKKFWDGLPADIRAVLEKCMKDTTTYVDEIAKKENDDALEAVKKSGKTEIIALTPEQKREWKKALLKVHRENEDRIGKDLIESIYRETGFDPGKL